MECGSKLSMVHINIVYIEVNWRVLPEVVRAIVVQALKKFILRK
jgi:hypothetical protein